MQEEFYAIIKLVSGEELFALVMPDEVNDDTVIAVSYTHLRAHET